MIIIEWFVINHNQENLLKIHFYYLEIVICKLMLVSTHTFKNRKSVLINLHDSCLVSGCFL